MSLIKDVAPTLPAPVAICLLDSKENGSFPIAQVCRGIRARISFNPLPPR